MPRYIDADIFKDAVPILEKRMDYRGKAKFINSVIAMIDIQPAADVQKVNHGEWKDDQDDVYWGNYIVKKHCSRCGYTPHFDRETGLFDLTKYCPNCGAKMDGEENEK